MTHTSDLGSKKAANDYTFEGLYNTVFVLSGDFWWCYPGNYPPFHINGKHFRMPSSDAICCCHVH